MPIFRKKALERISSPDQLDQLLHVTEPMGWLALMVCLLLLLFAGLWLVLGRIPVHVTGEGILLHGGGSVVIVTAPSEGRLVSYSVALGDQVTGGQKAVDMKQPEVEQLLLQLRGERDELLTQWRRVNERYHRILFLLRGGHDARRDKINEQLLAARRSLAKIQSLEEGQKELVKKGFTSVITLQETEAKGLSLSRGIADLESELTKLDIDQLQARQDLYRDLEAADEKITAVEQRIERASLELHEHSTVLSPVAGTVVGLLATPGNLIPKGGGLLSLSGGSGMPELLLYVTAGPAKQIKPGDAVQFSPAARSREEFGFVVGTVEAVSPLPVTRAEMIKDLGDETLVDQFSKAGAQIAVRVSFEHDPSSASGLRWSSRRGAQIPLSIGTLGSARVKVREERPIELVIPALRRWTGL